MTKNSLCVCVRARAYVYVNVYVSISDSEGATGSGVALDCATRGLKVAMVERDDFASGYGL